MEKHTLYTKAYIRSLDKLIDGYNELNKFDRESLRNSVFYSIKMIVTYPLTKTKKETEVLFKAISFVKNLVAFLTPNEFMQMFPVSKEYDGDRHEIKDYFYTMDYINGMDKNKPIGEKALEFLIEYTNPDINIFNGMSVTTLSELRQYDGHLDMLEEFVASRGKETPNTFKNSKGDVMYIRNGKPECIDYVESTKLRLV